MLKQYQLVRKTTELLCQPLLTEDYSLQGMSDTSPLKWHLAHTTWFFEVFLLKPYLINYAVFNQEYKYLFNSYYNAVGKQYPRDKRHLLSRPSIEDVYKYRSFVDQKIEELFDSLLSASDEHKSHIGQLIETGCHHEQQHQELMLTDLKYCWFQNPLYPCYNSKKIIESGKVKPIDFLSIKSGLYTVGHSQDGFCFDNELSSHQVYLEDFKIANRLVTNQEYLNFILDGAYQNSEYWLAEAWSVINQQGYAMHPLYWVYKDETWYEYTLHGLVPLGLNNPVCHISGYEADAYARWCNCRLATEFEWEVAQGIKKDSKDPGQFFQEDCLHPYYRDDQRGSASLQLTGKLWQWTSSAYSPYPKYKPAKGAIGEYNGKFMVNQLVLKGGSIAISVSHYRSSYRNFFYAKDRWQFTGICLAKDD